jgi:exosortase/archaeosortase family protein
MKVINTFLIKLFLFTVVYLILDNYLVPNIPSFNSAWEKVFHFGRNLIMNSSVFFLESLFNYNVVNSKDFIMIEGSVGFEVGLPCVGIGLTYSYVSLIISYPGLLKYKLFFLPLGIFSIYFLNVIRVVQLVIADHNNSRIPNQNLHDIFNFFIYALVFLLWIIWVKLESKTSANIENRE